MKGLVFDVRELSVHDGPGIRTTVFLKGCPLRCEWCHNPEGLEPRPQLMWKKALCTGCGACREACLHPECSGLSRCIHACPNGALSLCGEYREADELARELAGQRDLFALSGGGVTLSGGEPLLQWDFTHELLLRLREEGIHTAAETCGFASGEVFSALLTSVDYLLMDLKLASEEEHIARTGVSNASILRNLELLRASGLPCRLRTPLIPGITDTPHNLAAIKALAGELEWETLPCNPFAGAKHVI